MFYWLIALTSAFFLQIGNVYLSNIIFFVWILLRTVIRKNPYTFDRKSINIYMFYLAWVMFSMIIFSLQYAHLEVRNLVQFIYNIQYLILIVDGTIDKNKLRRAMYVSSYILAIVIIWLWITVTKMRSIPVLIVHYREWAQNYVGGWPNSTVLPLLFGIYLEMMNIMRKRKLMGLGRLGLLLFALLLCTSRTGYVGAALIIGYFLFTEREGARRYWKILKHGASIGGVIFVLYSLIPYITTKEMSGRMFMITDRMQIFTDMFSYFIRRPLTGYGGNTIDVIYEMIGPTITGINWGHTHNTILELLIRHGMVGAAAFMLFVFQVSKRITAKEDKAMYWLLWGLSMFQIFYKDFVFLLLIYLLLPSRLEGKQLNVQAEKKKCAGRKPVARKAVW